MNCEKNEKALPLRIPNLPFVAALLILIGIGLMLFAAMTENGVGLTNDSADYLGGARALLAGDGYVRYSGDRARRPITQFPPFYSVAIAEAVSLFKLPDVFAGARIVNGIAMALNLFLIAALALAAARREFLAICAAVLTLLSAPFLQAEVYGLSEAWSSVWILSGLIGLSIALRKSRRSWWVWLLIGAIFGVAMLIRYASLVFFAGAVFLAFANGRTLRERIEPVVFLSFGFGLLFTPWLIRNRLVGEGGVNRSFVLHFPTADRLWDGVRVLAGYFLPEVGGFVEKLLPLWVGVILLCIAALLIWVIRALIPVFIGRSHHPQGEAMPLSPASFFAFFLLSYLAELFLTAIFVDGSTVFDERMLYPVFWLAVLMICAGAANFYDQRRGRFIVVGALLVFALILAEDSFDRIQTYRNDGQGFAGAAWRDSETAAALDELADDLTCFSNRRTFLGLMKNLPCYVLPVGFDAATQRQSESFASDREWMRAEIEAGRALGIVFGWNEELDPESEDALYYRDLFDGLPLCGEYADGRIYATCKH